MSSNNSRMGSPLPSPIPCNNRGEKRSATAKSHKYLRRLVHFRHMDFEFAFWQMFYLFIAPQKVYRNFQYRKQTKDQFARDDPAFLVLLSFWLVVSSICFSLVLGFGFIQFVKFLFWLIFVECIGSGICVASLLWFLSNRYFRKPSCTDQDVEWGYSFDVHLNAFFPFLIILHIFHLFFLGVVGGGNSSFAPKFFGNTLWLIAIGYYIYNTFLGYSSLPILHSTQALLYPMVPLVITYFIFVLSGWSMSKELMQFYTMF